MAPGHVHLWLGSGRTESLATESVRPYWRRLRHQLRTLLDGAGGGRPTVAEPCAHCEFCEFAPVCTAEWRAADSLVYLAGIRGRPTATGRRRGHQPGRLAQTAVRPVDAP